MPLKINKFIKALIYGCVTILVFIEMPSAFSVSVSEKSLNETTSFNCKFSLEATRSGVSTQDPLELRFVVDDGTHKAYLIGNIGSSEVITIANNDGISFLEITHSGNVMVTTITNTGEAVHSRNGIMFNELVPSQLYGRCS